MADFSSQSPVCFADPDPIYKMCPTGIFYMLRGDNCSKTEARCDAIYWSNNNITWEHKPLNISFRCSRSTSTVDASIRNIYNTIVQGNVHTLLTVNPWQCAVNNNTGHCGNVRGALAECKCWVLNRKDKPGIRKDYEDSVISKVLSITGQNNKQFNVRLAMMATGNLLGEQCLLIRLVEALKKANCGGTIHVSLIDLDYKASINTSHAVAHLPLEHPFQWTQLLGHRKDFEQFVIEMSLCLPPTIVLMGEIFGSSEDYVLKAQKIPGYTHDLMIGADIEELSELMDEVNQIATRTHFPAIALVKRSENNKPVPKLCQIKDGREVCKNL